MLLPRRGFQMCLPTNNRTLLNRFRGSALNNIFGQLLLAEFQIARDRELSRLKKVSGTLEEPFQARAGL